MLCKKNVLHLRQIATRPVLDNKQKDINYGNQEIKESRP